MREGGGIAAACQRGAAASAAAAALQCLRLGALRQRQHWQRQRARSTQEQQSLQWQQASDAAPTHVPAWVAVAPPQALSARRLPVLQSPAAWQCILLPRRRAEHSGPRTRWAGREEGPRDAAAAAEAARTQAQAQATAALRERHPRLHREMDPPCDASQPTHPRSCCAVRGCATQMTAAAASRAGRGAGMRLQGSPRGATALLRPQRAQLWQQQQCLGGAVAWRRGA